MELLQLPTARDDERNIRHLHGHYDELLTDFRQRMAIALQALRDYEEAVRQGEYL